ncbi:hypothetical protein, partial [Streptomyces sp. NPDC001135]
YCDHAYAPADSYLVTYDCDNELDEQKFAPRPWPGRQWTQAGTRWRRAGNACCRVAGRHRPLGGRRPGTRRCVRRRRASG